MTLLQVKYIDKFRMNIYCAHKNLQISFCLRQMRFSWICTNSYECSRRIKWYDKFLEIVKPPECFRLALDHRIFDRINDMGINCSWKKYSCSFRNENILLRRLKKGKHNFHSEALYENTNSASSILWLY